MSDTPKLMEVVGLSTFTTEALVGELKSRGYMVVERDHVRTLGAEKRYPKDMALDSPMFREVVRKELGVALGYELAHSRHFEPAETERGVAMVAYQARVTFLGHQKISPLDPEYPLYLREEMNR